MENKSYQEFLNSKIKTIQDVGFDVQSESLSPKGYDFQHFIVKRALKAGRYAIFADCGLGKTYMQLEWANQVAKHTGKSVLILCPLAVSGQTIEEGKKFGIQVGKVGTDNYINVCNYEQLKNLDLTIYAGIVLDESSILKNFTGVYKNLIIESFKNFRFKIACTATPAPNDLNEIGNHAEFLDVMDANDM